MKHHLFNWLGNVMYGEEFEEIVATPAVDPKTGKLYVLQENSHYALEYEGEVFEWDHQAGVYEVVEVKNYDDHPDPNLRDAPCYWWCEECDDPPECLATLPTRPPPKQRPIYRELPAE
jgi:hypothetical protein